MTVEYSSNYSGFFTLSDKDIVFEIPPGQPDDAKDGWEFELNMGGWQVIEPDYPYSSTTSFPQWFAEKHKLSSGRYSFSWRMAYETIAANGEPAEYSGWIEISDITRNA